MSIENIFQTFFYMNDKQTLEDSYLSLNAVLTSLLAPQQRGET